MLYLGRSFLSIRDKVIGGAEVLGSYLGSGYSGGINLSHKNSLTLEICPTTRSITVNGRVKVGGYGRLERWPTYEFGGRINPLFLLRPFIFNYKMY
jgi:hypothetical protein